MTTPLRTGTPVRRLPIVLRGRLDQGGASLIAGKVTAVPDPHHVTIDVGGNTVVVPRVGSYVATVGEAAWCIAGNTVLLALGAVGSAGGAGTPGPAGPGVYGAARNPTAADGQNGDWWINTTTGALYGPKTAGAWPGSPALSMVGPQGPAGAQGATGPQGVKGDTGATGTQGAQGVKGDTGATGSQGPQGTTGAQGSQGDVGPQGVKGDTGAQGIQGPAGPSGASTFLSGTGAPTAGVGVDGSIYLDTATGRMYGPKAAGAWPATALGRIVPLAPTYAQLKTG